MTNSIKALGYSVSVLLLALPAIAHAATPNWISILMGTKQNPM